jgi:hypothetical protein
MVGALDGSELARLESTALNNDADALQAALFNLSISL